VKKVMQRGGEKENTKKTRRASQIEPVGNALRKKAKVKSQRTEEY